MSSHPLYFFCQVVFSLYKFGLGLQYFQFFLSFLNVNDKVTTMALRSCLLSGSQAVVGAGLSPHHGLQFCHLLCREALCGCQASRCLPHRAHFWDTVEFLGNSRTLLRFRAFSGGSRGALLGLTPSRLCPGPLMTCSELGLGPSGPLGIVPWNPVVLHR